jgi:two-component system response regulator
MKLLGKPLEILLTGENKGDIGLNEGFFEDTKIRINLHVAEDGEEAVRFLWSADKFLGSSRPDIFFF